MVILFIVVCRSKHLLLRTPVNIIIMNLGISDLLIMLFTTPLFIYNCMVQGPSLGNLGIVFIYSFII